MMYTQEIFYLVLFKLIKISIILSVGILGIKVLNHVIMRALEQRSTPHIRMIINKIIWYSGIALVSIMVLNELGFQLSALLGAAGIIGIAIGFASQTSMSNVISGLFVLSENFLAIGDIISCGSAQGVVESIDLFSIKIRTFDGKLVRIPNERLIKDTLTNETYYPLRRVEIMLATPGTVPVDKVMQIIDDVIAHNAVAKDHAHTVLIQSLSTDALHLIIQIWIPNNQLVMMKNTLISALQKEFETHTIKTFYIMPK